MIDNIKLFSFLAKEYGVSKLASYVIDNPNFSLWPASLDHKHHCLKGGLLEHTSEVVTLSINNADLLISRGYSTICEKTLFLAALFHDIGKLYDYTPLNQEMTEWGATLHKREIHHISRSAIEWIKAVEKTGQCKEIEDAVLHCILSHHGSREYGSPVMPHTREAWILHYSDAMSARVNDCGRIDMVNFPLTTAP